MKEGRKTICAQQKSSAPINTVEYGLIFQSTMNIPLIQNNKQCASLCDLCLAQKQDRAREKNSTKTKRKGEANGFLLLFFINVFQCLLLYLLRVIRRATTRFYYTALNSFKVHFHTATVFIQQQQQLNLSPLIRWIYKYPPSASWNRNQRKTEKDSC